MARRSGPAGIDAVRRRRATQLCHVERALPLDPDNRLDSFLFDSRTRAAARQREPFVP